MIGGGEWQKGVVKYSPFFYRLINVNQIYIEVKFWYMKDKSKIIQVPFVKVAQ